MSSSLFVMAMDILGKELDIAVRSYLFSPHPKCIDSLVTHLSFADDVLIFFDGLEQSLQGILEVLKRFYLASGLKLSLAKSKNFLDGNNQILTISFASRFSITLGSLHVMYLGLPLLPHKIRAEDYQPLLDNVNSKISHWSVRHLSYAGRLQLIQSVIYSLINFWAVVFPLPKTCLEELERLCSAFMWKGVAGTARGAKVWWVGVKKTCWLEPCLYLKDYLDPLYKGRVDVGLLN